MNEDFENRLQRQPLRQVPGQWRDEILKVARTTAVPAPATTPRSILSTINHRLSTLLWPTPYAWGGLAAVWLVIVLVNVASGDKQVMVAQKTEAPSPQIMAVVHEQQKMLAELIGLPEAPPVADRPRPHPLPPRSDRHARISSV